MRAKNCSDIDKYLSVIYNEKLRPYTQYPNLLAEFLFKSCEMEKGQKILDIGCGRGEFLSGFIEQGLVGSGVDRNIQIAQKNCPSADIKTADIEQDGLPFEDKLYDIVFSKSVIEHLYNPDKLMTEAKRVLKPGGTIITMCPSWEHNYKIYFEDYTHRTPFMKQSLHDIHAIHEFENIRVKYFVQLPLVWRKMGFLLLPLVFITRLFVPRKLSYVFKWVRFSKEIMLLSVAKNSNE